MLPTKTAMRRLRGMACVLLLAGLTAYCVTPGGEPPGRWWKGNTHTHTLWSDGNAAPEQVADWYKSHGYHFLVLSDHNVLSEGERWFPILEAGRLNPGQVEQLRQRFGADGVQVRSGDDGQQMRLLTLEELRGVFAAPGEFSFIQGEEITVSFEEHPVHVNGLNLEQPIAPRKGSDLRETLQLNVDAVIEHGQSTGRPVLAHINHPNFRWGLSWSDVAAVRGERFFEVYNGHSGVRNYGDEEHPGTEEMWDRALTWRLTETDLGLLYGLATDDSHEYFQWGVGHTNPGRGWVMVRAGRLEPDEIVAAMRRGDFYASSGVELSSIEHNSRGLRVRIAAQLGATYTTRFVGTRSGSNAIGETLLESGDNPAVYRFRGDELYVRAIVTSSRLHPNPYAAGDFEQAWVQPVVP